MSPYKRGPRLARAFVCHNAAMTTAPILFRHHRWSYRILFDSLETLPDDVLQLTNPGTFGTVQETLVHTLLNEQRFVKAVIEGGVIRLEKVPEILPSLRELREGFAEDAELLIKASAEVTPETTFSSTFHGKTVELPSVVPLFQSYNHGVEHRTDVTSILAAHGHELPPLHFWAFMDVGMP